MIPNIDLSLIKPRFPDSRLADPVSACAGQLVRFDNRVHAGMEIAVAVGSRGITGSAALTRTVIEYIKARGASPFIVPCMGSHGGATADGQRTILETYGINESAMGAPIRSSMDVVELPRGASPLPVYMDRQAFESDGVILINRIKPHTDFHGDYESGLVKMMTIGLGKHAQAMTIHEYGTHGLKNLMPRAARQIISSGKIIGGVALVENACDETMIVEAIRADEIFDREPPLLKTAAENMPGLPLDTIDILVVDFLGKNISGVGLDPNIIGRMSIRGEPDPRRPDIAFIVVSDITDESHGNALGIGLADVITRRLLEKIDFEAMYENVYTATFLKRATIPIVADNDRRALEFAWRSLGPVSADDIRLIRIRDTLHLGEMYASPAAIRELDSRQDASVCTETIPLFTPEGNLPVAWKF